MAKKILFLFLFCALGVNVSFAQQKVWNLQQCIEYALKNNIQVKGAQLNVELAKENLLQSKARVLPNLNGSFYHNYNFGKTIDPFTNTFATDRVLSQNLSLSSSMTLFNGLATYNTIKQNQSSFAAQKYDADKTRNEVSLNIASAYLQVLLSTELVDVASNQLTITKQQLERTQKLFDAGALAKGNLLDVESQLASEELQLVTSQNQLDIAYLSLVQYMQLESADGFKIEKLDIQAPNENSLVSTPTQIYDAATRSLPEVKSAELKIKSTEYTLNASKGQALPSLSLNGSYGTGYSGRSKQLLTSTPNGNQVIAYTTSGEAVVVPDFINTYETTPRNTQFNDNLNKSIGVSLRVPIFNNLQVRTAVSRAKINVESSKLELEQTQLQLRRSIQQAYADASGALKKYKASQKSVDALRESFKYTQQRFDVGLINSLDYNTVKNNLVRAESNLLQAKYEYVFKIKVLDYYQGKPISF
jgi:outer membrane protein